MSGANKGRALSEAPPQAPPSAAFGVSWADVTGQWEGLITSVGSSVGGLLPVVEPGSLVAGTATSWTKRPQARIASAPHADGRKAGDQRNAKKRSEHQTALSAGPVPAGLAVGGNIAVHTSSIAASGKGDQATVSNDTEQALADEFPASGQAPSQTKAQRPQEREKDRHRTILKERGEDDKHASKPHRSSPVEITSKPTRGVRMSKLHIALTSSVDSKVSVGRQAAKLRSLSKNDVHTSSRFSDAGHEDWVRSRAVPGSSLTGSRSKPAESKARKSAALDRTAEGDEPAMPDADKCANTPACADSLPPEALYPCTDAVHIPQRDIYDAGFPPEARAPLHRHNMTLAFAVSKLSAENIKGLDRSGKSDAFVQVRCGPIIQKSTTKKNVADCTWEDEVLVFILPPHVIDAVLEGRHEENSLSLSLFDKDAFSSDFIGHADIDLLQIVNSKEDGQDFSLQLSSNGELVTNEAGKITRIFLHIEREPDPHEGWMQPTLEDALASSHDDVQVCSTPIASRKRSKSSTCLTRWADPVVGDMESTTSENLDYYWREGLEKAMNSFSVNMLIVIVVLLDIIVAVAFLIRDETFQGGVVKATELFTSAESLFHLTWNATVNSIFVFEITMRQISMRGRFWGSVINVFDFTVVWLSVLSLGGYYALEYLLLQWTSQDFTSRDANIESSMGYASNAGIVRILAKVVQIARIVRAFYTLRKARNVSGQVNYVLRSAVSQNKRRMQWNGFDLDLTYITSRIIAMSVPAFGQATAYRNNIHQVSRYFALRHYGRFFIFNLCDTYDSSDGIMGQYNTAMLYNKVHRVPFEDHSPPLMSELLYFCQEAAAWMAQNSQNVVVVHCKGGKGRTGVMIAGLIMWTGHRKVALDALELFTFRRTSNYDPDKSLDGEEGDEDGEDSLQDSSGATGAASCCGRVWRRLFCCYYGGGSKPNQGVEGPSQLRYVHYLQAVLYNEIDPWAYEPCMVDSVEFPSCSFMGKKVWPMSLTLRCQRVLFYDSFAAAGSAQAISSSGHNAVPFPIKMSLSGDVRIDFYHHKKLSQRKRKHMCFVTFNTNFCKGRGAVVFKKSNVDMLHKDLNHKKVFADFQITVKLSHSCEDDFQKLFSRIGQRRKVKKGEVVVSADLVGDSLFYIQGGLLEGVVEQRSEKFHQLGNCLPSDVSAARSGDEPPSRRMPIMCLLGKGSVVGASQFLAHNRSMAFRVRSSEAQVLVLSKPVLRRAPSCENTPINVSSPLSGNKKRGFISRSISMMTGSGADNGILDVKHILDSISAGAEAEIEYRIPGVDDAELGIFYHGLAQALVPQLDRTQVEAIRISSLRAMNDTESLLSEKDLDENLRVSCVHVCKIPIHEKILHVFRCSMTISSKRKIPLTRVLILNNYVIFDPEYYGPRVSKACIVVPVSQMQDVGGLHQKTQNSFDIRLFDWSMPTPSNASTAAVEAGLTESGYTLAFSSDVRMLQAYRILQDVCRRGSDKRHRLTNRVHRAHIIASFAKRCGQWHTLRKNEELVVIKTSPALFVVCAGALVLKHKGMIYRIVECGSSFGVENLVQCRADGTYDAFAESNGTVILELRHSEVTKLTDQDRSDYGKFYHYLCMLIESDYDDLLRSMFPGTWSQQPPQQDLGVDCVSALSQAAAGLVSGAEGARASKTAHTATCTKDDKADGQKASPPAGPGLGGQSEGAQRNAHSTRLEEGRDGGAKGVASAKGVAGAEDNGLLTQGAMTPGKGNAV